MTKDNKKWGKVLITESLIDNNDDDGDGDDMRIASGLAASHLSGIGGRTREKDFLKTIVDKGRGVS